MKNSAQEIFLQANQCYAKKEFKEAENLYKKIPKKSAAVWYNLGNCAYKSGNDMQALLYWKRASKLGDKTIKANSEYNTKLVADKLNISLKNPSHLQNVPVLPLQILFFCLFSVFLFTNRKLWRTKRFIMLGVLGILVLSAGIITYASYRTNTSTFALAMSAENMAYVGPDVHYHQLAQIPLASEVKVLASEGSWVKIDWNGSIGWIENNKIEIL